MSLEMGKRNSESRIYQPNLTCTYHKTMTPCGRVGVLTVINKDEGVGINDDQIVTSMWSWVKDFSRRLKSQDVNWENIKEIPTCDVMLTLNKNASVYSVIAVCLNEDMVLNDVLFVTVVGNYAQAMAKQLGVELEEAGE